MYLIAQTTESSLSMFSESRLRNLDEIIQMVKCYLNEIDVATEKVTFLKEKLTPIMDYVGVEDNKEACNFLKDMPRAYFNATNPIGIIYLEYRMKLVKEQIEAFLSIPSRIYESEPHEWIVQWNHKHPIENIFSWHSHLHGIWDTYFFAPLVTPEAANELLLSHGLSGEKDLENIPHFVRHLIVNCIRSTARPRSFRAATM